MRNLKLSIQYDGTRYKGWQKQNQKGKSISTIQDKIEKVLSKMTGEEIQLIGCGRTDTGVHAEDYTASFKTNSMISIEDMLNYLCEFLPEDIVVKSMKDTSERFHARFNVKSKTYVYMIDNNKFLNVFHRKYSYHVAEKLNVEKMKDASKVLLGTHDFQSFTSLKSNSKSTIRTINYIDIRNNNNEIEIEINGNSFLLNMVRIIVGTLIEVGVGNLTLEDFTKILEEKKKSELVTKAPAKGLTMKSVQY